MPSRCNTLRFFRNPSCRECPLHEGVQTVCVPAAPLTASPGDSSPSSNRTSTGRDTAVLIVGEAPGGFEDRHGIPFIGPVGRFLRDKYIGFFHMDDHADVFLTNAVRCRPPANATPPIGPIRKCHHYLENDIRTLQQHYPCVVLLVVGATAARSLLNVKLNDAFRRQPHYIQVNGSRVPVFVTYHPGAIMPGRRDGGKSGEGRNPALAHNVGEHLQLLMAHVRGQAPTPIDMDEIHILTSPNPPDGLWKNCDASEVNLVLDIETYGILNTMPAQRYMHPERSHRLDAITKEQMIPLVGLYNPSTPHEVAVFHPNDWEHFQTLNWWLRELRNAGGTLIGANIKFDLLYLRYCYPALELDGLPTEDVLVWAYLDNELRRERSLKSLTSLFGIADYPPEIYKGFVQYPRWDDPALLRYNALDCVAAWRLREHLLGAIADHYGPDSPKLSPFSRQWYSDLTWLLIHMTEAGVAVDITAASALRNKCRSTCLALNQRAIDEWGGIFAGTGSGGFAATLMEEAVEAAGLINDPRLEISKKTHVISTGKRNRHLVLAALPPDHPKVPVLNAIKEFKSQRKLASTWLAPLLDADNKDKYLHPIPLPALGEGTCGLYIVYPDWFGIPSIVGRGDRNTTEGGTIQCRITCKNPGLQTYPPTAREILTCRHRPGSLLIYDLSQCEYRMAALQSGDEAMIRMFVEDRDIHTETARAIFAGGLMPELGEAIKRQVGKKTNFLVIYRGSAGMLRWTLILEVGLQLSYYRCQKIIDNTYAQFPRLREWQDEKIAETERLGYAILPLIGTSRRLPGAATANREPYAKIAVNMRIQAEAANVLLSAQKTFVKARNHCHLLATTGFQGYDSMYIECPASEVAEVKSIMAPILTNPPYWQALCDHYGRTVPLAYDLKEITYNVAGIE